MRRQLGSAYGIRAAYGATRVGSDSYMPFSKMSLRELKKGIAPSSKILKILNLMFKIIIVAILIFKSFSVSAQSVDNKYLIAIIAIKSDQKLDREIRSFFSKDIPKESNFVSLHIAKKISLIDIEPFREEIANIDQSSIDISVFEAEDAFTAMYGFSPFENKILGGLIPAKHENLILYFSKPIGNFLAAELTNFDMDLTSGVRFGKGFRILFQFNQKGLIENIFWRTYIYN